MIDNKGGTSAVMPYVAVIGALGVGYFLLKDKTQNFIGAAGNRVIERTSETVKEVVNNTTKNISESFNTLSTSANNLNDEMNDNPVLKFIAPDIQRESDYTPEMETALNNYKKGNITEKTVAAEGSLYNKIFGSEMFAGIDNPLSNWFFTGRPEGKEGKNTTKLPETNQTGLTGGLGEVTTSIINLNDANKPIKKGTQKSNKVTESVSTKAMPLSNLKNAEKVTLVKDKSGVTRKKITYRKGDRDAGKITLRY